MSTPALFPSPIGVISPGHPAMTVGIAIKHRVCTYGPHVVLVDSHGRVFIRPEDEPRASLMASRYPAMVVGIFNDAATSRDIAEAMVFVYNEQLSVVAA